MSKNRIVPENTTLYLLLEWYFLYTGRKNITKNSPKKIHIIGSLGSGKTTYAKKLSIQTNIQHYELDNVVWQRKEGSGDIKRSKEERDQCLSNIIQLDQWIIEGVHHTWIDPSLDQADLIILLDTPYRTRIYRISKRFIRQKLGMEKANYVPTFQMFFNMFKWNKYFEEKSKPEILDLLEKYDDNVVILKSNADMSDFMESRLRQ